MNFCLGGRGGVWGGNGRENFGLEGLGIYEFKVLADCAIDTVFYKNVY
jgi:hypothetical protein